MSHATSGVLSGMILCPANGVDTFRIFNGSSGAFKASQVAVYRDNIQSYSTTEPALCTALVTSSFHEGDCWYHTRGDQLTDGHLSKLATAKGGVLATLDDSISESFLIPK
jgi:hypothetical protein